jgi:transposase-like protein
MVCGLSLELLPGGRTPAGTWGVGQPRDHPSLGAEIQPQLEEAFHRRKRPVWLSWRMDETYIKVKGEWRYLYRAVDKSGQTIDFLLTDQRDEQAAMRFLTKAIRRHGVPETITIDGSEANAAAIRGTTPNTAP